MSATSKMLKQTNNPFNIRFSTDNDWLGLTGNYRGFCQFETIDYGLRAGIKLLNGYISRGYDTVERIVNRFAPPCENPTSSYVEFVKSEFDKAGVSYKSFKQSYDSNFLFILCRAICRFESGYVLTSAKFRSIVNVFFTK